MLEQLLIKRPDNPIKFFIEILKRENENGYLMCSYPDVYLLILYYLKPKTDRL